VCTHIIHMTPRKKLVTYDGNYDQFMKTKTEKEENQMKQYKWEQEQIKSMKEYIARFGHGTAKNAKQAQSKEKVLQKMIRAGLTDKPEEEKPLNFKFTDPGHLPPPVLAFHDVEFGYPGCEPLYKNVNFGVDLDSRVALVGPNGAGKTTLIKLYVWLSSNRFCFEGAITTDSFICFLLFAGWLESWPRRWVTFDPTGT